MNERLQKILSAKGIASRRKAEEIIKQGRVRVNGAVATLGDSADPDTDEITVDGKALTADPEKVYIMLNKPMGYVTTVSDEKGRPTAFSLVESCGVRVYPVGRLDMDSQGLLLFTNDGELANKITHPSNEKEKTYKVTVRGDIAGKPQQLCKPMEIDGYMTSGAKVKALSSKGEVSTLAITIHEGRNRQVRKMCLAVGLKVLKLERVSEDGLTLGDLPLGKWRYLSEEEIKIIKH